MSKHGENIRKRKDGRWEGRFIKGRKSDRTQSGDTFMGILTLK